VELQHVKHLHVGEPETHFFCGLGVEEDARGNELANFEQDGLPLICVPKVSR
jgi:hypothetical protein